MKNNALSDAFVFWQCYTRQTAIRQQRNNSGAIQPTVFCGTTAEGQPRQLGRIVTILNRKPEHELTSEFRHFYRKTQDPQQRLESVLKLLSEYYYQDAQEFSDQLTATFSADSALAKALLREGQCQLSYQHHSQGYDVDCQVTELTEDDPLYQATFWHNILFNPNLSTNIHILAFIPNWAQSKRTQS